MLEQEFVENDHTYIFIVSEKSSLYYSFAYEKRAK